MGERFEDRKRAPERRLLAADQECELAFLGLRGLIAQSLQINPNQPLAFSANPTYTANFSSNGNDTNPCTSSTSLPPGTACDVSVNFTPQSAGSLSAGINVANNTLNVTGSTEQVSATGTGLNLTDSTATAVAVSPTSVVSGQSVTITATVADTATGHTSNSPSGSVSFTDTVGSTVTSLNNGASVNLANKTASLNSVVLNGVGTHTITANYSGSEGQYTTSSCSTTVVVGKASVTVTGPAQPVSLSPGQAGSGHTSRRVFEALRLEIRYDSSHHIARCSITLTAGARHASGIGP